MKKRYTEEQIVTILREGWSPNLMDSGESKNRLKRRRNKYEKENL